MCDVLLEHVRQQADLKALFYRFGFPVLLFETDINVMTGERSEIGRENPLCQHEFVNELDLCLTKKDFDSFSNVCGLIDG